MGKIYFTGVPERPKGCGFDPHTFRFIGSNPISGVPRRIMKKIKIIIIACLCLLVIFCSSGFMVLNLEEDELSGMPCDNPR